jgi:hypothetical protein
MISTEPAIWEALNECLYYQLELQSYIKRKTLFR